jgi:hypothetical protein
MHLSAGASPAPRPRSRRAQIAALFALLSLGTCAPEGCYVSDGAGGQLKLNEVSSANPNTPDTRPCSICGVRAPQQYGPGGTGAGSGKEKSPKSGSKAGGSGEVKGPAEDKKKGKGKKDPAGKPEGGPAMDPKQGVCLVLATQMAQMIGLPDVCAKTQVTELNGSLCAKVMLGKAASSLAQWKRERERWSAELLEEMAKGDRANPKRKREIAEILRQSQTATDYLTHHRDDFVAQCMAAAPAAAAPATGGS